ncbi:TPA: S8 family serine peptidase [Streptococcus pneumoniae]|nr:S8 family serine peptidase [Streptococcus pneumoniae]HEW9377854.1 S8 family serine peptidase [Streptococcus pneumoniae]
MKIMKKKYWTLAILFFCLFNNSVTAQEIPKNLDGNITHTQTSESFSESDEKQVDYSNKNQEEVDQNKFRIQIDKTELFVTTDKHLEKNCCKLELEPQINNDIVNSESNNLLGEDNLDNKIKENVSHLDNRGGNIEHDKDNLESSIVRKYEWDIDKVTGGGESYKLYSKSNSKVSIAILDSGVDLQNTGLLKNLSNHSKNYVPNKGYLGKEEGEEGIISDIQDRLGHGTAVVAQIVGDDNINGVNPHVNINVYRIFGKSSASPDWIVKAIFDAVDDGNDIINLSTGQYLMIDGEYEDGTNDFETFLKYKKAIDYANQKGVIIVAALGNDSLNVSNQSDLLKLISSRKKVRKPGLVVDVPSYFSSTISVGGIDRLGNLSDFSNKGDSDAIYAPAGSTLSLSELGLNNFINAEKYKEDWIFSATLGGYTYLYGNSFAAPKVSGAIAMIIDKYKLKDQLYNYMFVKKILEETLPVKNGIKVLNIPNVLRYDLNMLQLEYKNEQSWDSFIDNVNLIELEERIQTTIGIKQINTHNIITIAREGYSQNYLPNTSENTYNSLQVSLVGVLLLFISMVNILWAKKSK